MCFFFSNHQLTWLTYCKLISYLTQPSFSIEIILRWIENLRWWFHLVVFCVGTKYFKLTTILIFYKISIVSSYVPLYTCVTFLRPFVWHSGWAEYWLRAKKERWSIIFTKRSASYWIISSGFLSFFLLPFNCFISTVLGIDKYRFYYMAIAAWEMQQQRSIYTILQKHNGQSWIQESGFG